ncbi:uncharacterized protein [Antedon mediterranea]|uniref:uncharacterized protein isoform X3 n=1 Tax=Antedon mediterranea TaxID=105859 RepID=UPI003AF45060
MEQSSSGVFACKLQDSPEESVQLDRLRFSWLGLSSLSTNGMYYRDGKVYHCGEIAWEEIQSAQLETRLPVNRKSHLPPPKINTTLLKSPEKKKLPHLSPTSPTIHRGLQIGDTVCTEDHRIGTLKYKGTTHFAAGTWVGIHLQEPIGKHDGNVDGVQYFECEENHGVFILASKVYFVNKKDVGLPDCPPTNTEENKTFDYPSSKLKTFSKENNSSKFAGKLSHSLFNSKVPRPKTLPVFHRKSNPEKTEDVYRVEISPVEKIANSKISFHVSSIAPVEKKITVNEFLKDSNKKRTLNSTNSESCTAKQVYFDKLQDDLCKPYLSSTSQGLKSIPSFTDLTEQSADEISEFKSRLKPLDSSSPKKNTFSSSHKFERSRKDDKEVVSSFANIDLVFSKTQPSNSQGNEFACHVNNNTFEDTQPNVSSELIELEDLSLQPKVSDDVRKTSEENSNQYQGPLLGESPTVPLADIQPRTLDIDSFAFDVNEDGEFSEFLAIPSFLDSPSGRWKFDLLTPVEFAKALNESDTLNLWELDPPEEPYETDLYENPETNREWEKHNIWEPITIVEEEFLSDSFDDKQENSKMEEASRAIGNDSYTLPARNNNNANSLDVTLDAVQFAAGNNDVEEKTFVVEKTLEMNKTMDIIKDVKQSMNQTYELDENDKCENEKQAIDDIPEDFAEEFFKEAHKLSQELSKGNFLHSSTPIKDEHFQYNETMPSYFKTPAKGNTIVETEIQMETCDVVEQVPMSLEEDIKRMSLEEVHSEVSMETQSAKSSDLAMVTDCPSGSKEVKMDSGSNSQSSSKKNSRSELSTVLEVEMTMVADPKLSSQRKLSSKEKAHDEENNNDLPVCKDKVGVEHSKLPRKRTLQQPKTTIKKHIGDSTSDAVNKLSKTSRLLRPSVNTKHDKPDKKPHNETFTEKADTDGSGSQGSGDNLNRKTYSPTSWKENKKSTERKSLIPPRKKPLESTTKQPGTYEKVKSRIDATWKAQNAAAAKAGVAGKRPQTLVESVLRDLETRGSLSSSTRSLKSDTSGSTQRPSSRASSTDTSSRGFTKKPKAVKRSESMRERRTSSTSATSETSFRSGAMITTTESSRQSSRSGSPEGFKEEGNKKKVSTLPKSRLVKPSAGTSKVPLSKVSSHPTRTRSKGGDSDEQPDIAQVKKDCGNVVSSLTGKKKLSTKKNVHLKDSSQPVTKPTKIKPTISSSTPPDLLSSSIANETAAEEIKRLEALCESRTKELNLTKMQLKNGLTGFDALAILLQHLTNDMDVFSCSDLKRNIKDLEMKYKDTYELAETLTEEKLKLEEDQEILKEQHEEKIEKLKQAHKQSLEDMEDTLNGRHSREMNELVTQQTEDIDLLHKRYKRELSDQSEQNHHLIELLKTKHNEEKTVISEEHEVVRKEMQNEFDIETEKKRMAAENRERQLQDDSFNLKFQCERLTQKSKMLEDVLQKDSDEKLQAAIAQYKDLPDEVESLKTVLELRNKDIHDLRRQKMELEKELEVIPEQEEKIKKYERRIEELTVIVGKKVDFERQLSSEHRALKESLDKQSTEKKRLSMENEELVWKLQQSECGSPICLTPPTTRMTTPRSHSRTNLSRSSSSETGSHDNVFMYEHKLEQSFLN